MHWPSCVCALQVAAASAGATSTASSSCQTWQQCSKMGNSTHPWPAHPQSLSSAPLAAWAAGAAGVGGGGGWGGFKRRSQGGTGENLEHAGEGLVEYTAWHRESRSSWRGALTRSQSLKERSTYAFKAGGHCCGATGCCCCWAAAAVLPPICTRVYAGAAPDAMPLLASLDAAWLKAATSGLAASAGFCLGSWGRMEKLLPLPRPAAAAAPQPRPGPADRPEGGGTAL
jgi:hypothetical protein